MVVISFICILLVFVHLILRIWIVGLDKRELPEEGKEVNIWGKIILALVGIIVFIVIAFAVGMDSLAMKWFWMLFVILTVGFQSFIDWKYQRESRQYIVSLIVLVLGIVLVYYLL
ncbi:uncharacterized protein DUF4181 [Fontibacillus phaseoli]|uniref:Uncharacterized protein DUF4181 n=1 Tax=Fontibacillus phaseoli TaxID=1416533 RepID=A0A369BIM4_9BACL|nr:DUF4181 domain-containing protein [Fontibacillus phaseoli]RCX21440.1 uncharacterized protein DUF4181 [Fontibacillus phaseoli]